VVGDCCTDDNTFYFHIKKAESFCLVTDDQLHINARFRGNHNADSSRDFTWAQALDVTFGVGHKLYVGDRRAAEWDEDEDRVVIALDGKPVDLELAENAR
jgi:hypothetical protein